MAAFRHTDMVNMNKLRLRKGKKDDLSELNSMKTCIHSAV